jgi:2-polyprenyl-3-methyl-5-hydroxy-6-metoxy-1,4-benzoquinol methylase
LGRVQYQDSVSQYFNGLASEDFERSERCMLCGKKGRKVFQKGTLEVYRCECEFYYSANQPKQHVLDKFYSSSDAMTQWVGIKHEPGERLKQMEKFGPAINFIRDTNIKSVLDIGCGNGVFLDLLSLANLDRRVGIDQNEHVTNNKVEGAQFYQIGIDDYFKRFKERFHMYALWGVLEHVKEPMRLLRTIHWNSPDDAMICVTVPNVYSLIARLTWEKCFTFCPQHLHYFNRLSLQELFRQCGWEVLTYWTIEPETIPCLRAMSGFDPYDKSFPVTVNEFKHDGFPGQDWINANKMGYKITMIGRKIETRCDNPSTGRFQIHKEQESYQTQWEGNLGCYGGQTSSQCQVL